MGYERRGNHVYYYQATRIDGRVVKKYIGKGSLANAVAAQQRQQQSARKASRAHVDAEKARLEPLDQQTDQLQAAANAVAAKHLESLGFKRQHHRWRLQRHGRRNDAVQR